MKSKLKIIIPIIILLIACIISVSVLKNNKKDNNTNNEQVIEKEINHNNATGSLLITKHNNRNTVNKTDLTIDESYIETIIQIITSKSIAEKINEKYDYKPEYQFAFNNSILTVRMSCNTLDDNKCIETLNEVLRESSNQIETVMHFDSIVLDEATILKTTE